MGGRLSRTFYALALSVAFVCGFSATALAVVQDGRVSTNNNPIDGASVYVRGDSFNARSGQCVLYGMLTYSNNGRHVESGVVRCVSASIDGTCPSGNVFNERFNGSSYFCTPGGTFTNGSEIYVYNRRNSAGSDTFTTYGGGASVCQPRWLHRAHQDVGVGRDDPQSMSQRVSQRWVQALEQVHVRLWQLRGEQRRYLSRRQRWPLLDRWRELGRFSGGSFNVYR